MSRLYTLLESLILKVKDLEARLNSLGDGVTYEDGDEVNY